MRGENLCARVEIRDYDDYLDLLKAVEPFTKFIAVIQIDGYDPEDVVMQAADDMMESAGRYKTGNWPGTRVRGNRAQVHMYRSNHKFFNWLRDGDAFFYNSEDDWGCDVVEQTDFGFDDIVFMDQNQDILMYTTTHEGDIFILEGLI